MVDKIKQEHFDLAAELVKLKGLLMKEKLYRTGQKLEIAIKEIGWEMQGVSTPKCVKQEQKEFLS